MAIYNVETMDEHIQTAYFLPHLAAALFGVFGVIGLVLRVRALWRDELLRVSRRTREIRDSRWR